MQTLYEQLGGEPAVNAAVDIFYRKVLADPTVSHFFDTIDMDKQLKKQKAFLTLAFGGPNKYSGKGIRNVHKHLNLEEKHFTAVATHLNNTLKDLKVPQNLIDEVMKIAASTHDDVLNC